MRMAPQFSQMCDNHIMELTMISKLISKNQEGSSIKKSYLCGRECEGKVSSEVPVGVGISRATSLHYLPIRTSVGTFPDDKAPFSTVEVGLQN